MFPAKEEAEWLLSEAEACNPGPWGDHSRVTAQCAARIAAHCPELNSEKAYILGLLHDIGRKFGTRHLGHVVDGYRYMLQLGYDEVARVCLSHSFHSGSLTDYIGNIDTTPQELQVIENALHVAVYDEYDRLIQLCDALAGASGVLNIEQRMEDVRQRYGSYPQSKWDANMALLTHFEEKCGSDIYNIVRIGKRNF